MRRLLVILFLIGSVAESLKLYRIHVPHYKLSGENALLHCEYDMGNDRLYAVKWYKDNEEFFRYVPRYNPPIHIHPVDGVNVERLNSNSKEVMLSSVNVRSTGVYRCEVSAEAPSFASIMGEGRMTVVYLPKEGPQITGTIQNEYEVGDILDLNCTSSKSFPPAKISWYINDMPVAQFAESVPYDSSSETHGGNEHTWIDPVTNHAEGHGHSAKSQHSHSSRYKDEEEYPQTNSHSIGSEVGVSPKHPESSPNSLIKTSMRRLRLQLSPEHFDLKGTAKVKCVARIFPLFWQDGDEKVFVGGGHSNRKVNDVDYSHDSLHNGGNGHHSQAHQEGKKFLYNRDTLVSIRGGCGSVVLSYGGTSTATLTWRTLLLFMTSIISAFYPFI